MTEPTVVTGELAELERAVAAARRRLAAGRPLDMTGLAGRIRALAGAGGTGGPAERAGLLALMSECDRLVGELQAAHDGLASELRGARERRQALTAYRRPGKG